MNRTLRSRTHIRGAAVFLVLAGTALVESTAQRAVHQDQQAREINDLSARVAQLKVQFLEEAQLYSPQHPVLQQHLQEVAALTAILEKKQQEQLAVHRPLPPAPPLPPLPPVLRLPEIRVIAEPEVSREAVAPKPPAAPAPRQSAVKAEKQKQQQLARQTREVDRLTKQVAQAKKELAELKQEQARRQARASAAREDIEQRPPARAPRTPRPDVARQAKPAPRQSNSNAALTRRIDRLENELEQIKSILVRLLDLVDRAIELGVRD